MTEADAKAMVEAGVSRETFGRLSLHASLLAKWQHTINLVSPSTLSAIWSRHILDSAQLMDHIPSGAGTWLDLGSGGGFPGLVCAAIALEKNPEIHFTLVEADLRKAAFLREAARQMNLSLGVMSRRIEDIPPSRYDVISARALAPLTGLCRYAKPYISEDGVCLFQKGARYLDEIAAAEKDWHMVCHINPSLTDAEAVLITIEKFQHV
jgi:16S rRNA (guanine527-N7)-methyltransferase